MTKEEAIKLIDTHTVCFYNEIDSPTLQALHMAIEALSAEVNLYALPKAITVRPLTEEIAIEFLQDSGWLQKHDKEIGNPPMLVRCKDCRHHGMRDCSVWEDCTTEDYMWCYYGERREP